ncbi:MAG: peptidase U32 family protein [bacterium]
MNKPELLAPAGNIEKMKTAFAFGADAVYLGIPDFSLRVRINDFTVEQIAEAVEYAHQINKKVYVTLNIFAHNKHLDKLPPYVEQLKKIKVDGLFISDPGIIYAVREIWPEARISLSTQANCTNWQAAKFWQDQGLARVILGREVSIEEIKEIRKHLPELELEAFVHGALCMSYSGRCFLSKLITGRSANLGDCAQPCRWKYDVTIKPQGHDHELEIVEEEHGTYLLNSHDLCLIKRLPEMIDSGLSAFKIEGRAKSVYYLATVIGIYRKAIDMICEEKLTKKEIEQELSKLYAELEEKLFHRGYTEGFSFGQGQLAQNLEDSHNYPEWEFCGQVLKSKSVENGFEIKIKVHNTLLANSEVEAIIPEYDIIKVEINEMIDEETGESRLEAHGGGGGRIVIIKSKVDLPEFTVFRRKIENNNNNNNIKNNTEIKQKEELE